MQVSPELGTLRPWFAEEPEVEFGNLKLERSFGGSTFDTDTPETCYDKRDKKFFKKSFNVL